MLPALNRWPALSALSIIRAAIRVASWVISSLSWWPTFGIERAAWRRRGTTSLTDISSIMGLIVWFPFGLW
jgi:hypothetical protein